jgi:hypothetical protein
MTAVVADLVSLHVPVSKRGKLYTGITEALALASARMCVSL